MYTEQDLIAIRAQQKKRWIYLTIPCLVLLAVIVYSLTVRIQWLTIGATILLGTLFLFIYEMTIKPLHCYEIHLSNALHGRKRELDCTYHSIDADLSVVDGVNYYAMTVLQPDEKGDPFERMLYWDALKPAPALKPGDKLHIIYHDRMVAQLTQV